MGRTWIKEIAVAYWLILARQARHQTLPPQPGASKAGSHIPGAQGSDLTTWHAPHLKVYGHRTSRMRHLATAHPDHTVIVRKSQQFLRKQNKATNQSHGDEPVHVSSLSELESGVPCVMEDRLGLNKPGINSWRHFKLLRKKRHLTICDRTGVGRRREAHARNPNSHVTRRF